MKNYKLVTVKELVQIITANCKNENKFENIDFAVLDNDDVQEYYSNRLTLEELGDKAEGWYGVFEITKKLEHFANSEIGMLYFDYYGGAYEAQIVTYDEDDLIKGNCLSEYFNKVVLDTLLNLLDNEGANKDSYIIVEVNNKEND